MARLLARGPRWPEVPARPLARARALGQPRGLWVLAGTELWDRISFHGMQAMLVLYMTGDLLVDPVRVRSVWGFDLYRRMVEAMTGPLTDTRWRRRLSVSTSPSSPACRCWEVGSATSSSGASSQSASGQRS